MPDYDDQIGGLPDVIRDSNRPIIIYQGVSPGQFDPVTSNALGLLSWLSILTICLIAIGVSFWSLWNPGNDPSRYSPIHVEGQPRGLANRVSERREINAQTAGLLEYVDGLHADNADRRRTNETHALITEAGGIDALRREWDAACRSVRTRIYDRRIGTLDGRLSEARRQLRQTQDPAQRATLEANVSALAQQRRDELERRRTDSDPALRCTPAAEAPVCPRTSEEPWCNPNLRQPNEFAERRSP
jgi:hypothetical protein